MIGIGATIRQAKEAREIVEAAFPDPRTIPDDLWQAAQARPAAEAVATHPGGSVPFRQRRRPRHLPTGKVVCGCGGAFSPLGKDYLGCIRAKNAGACRNTRRVRPPVLDQQAMAALGSSLMQPEAVRAFCEAFVAEWNRMAAEASASARAHHAELADTRRKIANLVDALSDSGRSPSLMEKLTAPEARRRALEAAHTLIDRVVVSPPDSPDDPPGIELLGNLMAMLKAGGVKMPKDSEAFAACLSATLASSTKEDRGEKFPSPPDPHHTHSRTLRPPARVFAAPGGRAQTPALPGFAGPSSRPPIRAAGGPECRKYPRAPWPRTRLCGAVGTDFCRERLYQAVAPASRSTSSAVRIAAIAAGKPA